MDPLSDHEKEKIERLRRTMYSRSLSPLLHDRDRRELHHQTQLPEEWRRDESGAATGTFAPRTIGWARTLLTTLLIISGIFFLGASAFFAYYFTFGTGSLPAVPENIDITVVGPEQATGGEPVSLQIVVANRNRTALELADLVISYPPGTRSVSDTSLDVPEQRISLGSIEPGGRRQGTVSAVLSGKGGDRAVIPVEVEYRLAGSNSVFVAKKKYAIAFVTSPLAVEVQGNAQTVSGQTTEIVVTVSSNASTVLRGVFVRAEMPFGFTLSSVDPVPVKGEASLWDLGDFRPGEKKILTVRGAVRGEKGDARTFRFVAGTKKKPADTSITVPLYEQRFATTITQPFIDLSIVTNHGTGSNAVVAPGETVVVTIGWHNNLRVPISNAVIAARLSGVLVEGTGVKTTDGFYRSSDNVILWDKSTTNGTLGTLAPDASGTVSFSFIMPSSEVLMQLRDPRLIVSVNAGGARLSESGVPENLQSAASKTVKIASDLQLVAQGLYYTNPFGSAGPLPPKVGNETTYALVFTVTNTTSKIDDAVLTAELPSYVRWTGFHTPSSEKIEFDAKNSRIVWRLNTIEPGTGLSGKAPRQVAISIGFTPSASQIGSAPVLVKNVTLIGQDAVGTGVQRTATPDVTTNLLSVSQAGGGTRYAGESGFSAVNATVIK